ncbi:L,D-transpeptidase [Ideonella sp. DXS29W]|uniref:L,D-transpeptidase n=1 Tax=Ideonella lacteola TaxID=2984193 RepID=A0ABU9BKA0_9BURK
MRAACLAVWCGLLAGAAQASGAIADSAPWRRVDFLEEPASAEVRAVAVHAFERGDAHGRPIAIVDKQNARIFVFGADGVLRGTTPVLLGLARGNESAPGIGKKAGGYIAPAERTTPAGRFNSEPGHNAKGEAIVWVDYDAAFAIHRLRPAPAAERRPARLASPSPDDNRISQGCVIVSGAFYDEVIAPVLGRQRGVVYVLPDRIETLASNG